LRDLAGLVAMIEGGQELALGQIASRSEDDEIEDLDRDDTRGHFLCSAIKGAFVLNSVAASDNCQSSARSRKGSLKGFHQADRFRSTPLT
jgi:hypothetical protein